ncbi:MAG: N-formylglutamate deformylase [Paracoccaceae bacterium]
MIEVVQGDGPVVLGLPHTGTDVPPGVWAQLNATGRALHDTDWHVERLFRDILPGATRVRTPVHRYVVDCNRPPDGASLYPGQATTGLVPMTEFDGAPIWTVGPDDAEVARRLPHHAAYHSALAAQVARVRAAHGHAILFDCHSIRSVVPRLFDGTLPELNVGTDGGRTCDPAVEAIVADGCAASPFTWVLNGRFRGGWTTRHYGAPADGVHAIQLEIAQSAYLATQAPPFAYDPAKADRLRATLAPILAALASWRPAR